MATTLLALAFAAVAAALIQFAITGLRCSLGSVPGPWHTRFSHWAVKWHVLAGSRVHYVDALHRRYGPVVRVAPGEVSVADVDAFWTVHRAGSGFAKAEWYDMMVAMEPGLFAERDARRHAARRRLLSHPFSNSSLTRSWLPDVRAKVRLAVGRIAHDAAARDGGGGGGEADLLKWWTLMAQDVIAHLSFGESFHMIEQGKQDAYIDAIQNSVLVLVTKWEMPWLYALLPYIPSAPVRKLLASMDVVYEHSARATQNLGRAETPSLFSQMIDAANNNSSDKSDNKNGGERETTMTDRAIRSEAGNFIIAGSDTTAVTLTYLVWSVLRQPELQRALEDEASGLADELDLDEIKRAPLLNSVIQETLRLFPPIPGALPRVVPAQGAALAGHSLAPGTVVSNQCYTIQRDGTIFENPDQFDGRRFIDPDNMTPRQKKAMSAFGAGSRICIGIHLAMMEIQLATALFFKECKGAKLSPKMTEAEMHMEERFFVSPQGHRMLITL